MALQVALADFQLVHPTETEVFKDIRPTGMFDKNGQPVDRDHGGTRRKRVPLNDARVVIKNVKVLGARDPVEMSFPDDRDTEARKVANATGRIICGVTQDHLPQAPMECEFELYGPKGLIERGKVRCGGNEGTPTREVVLQSA